MSLIKKHFERMEKDARYRELITLAETRAKEMAGVFDLLANEYPLEPGAAYCSFTDDSVKPIMLS